MKKILLLGLSVFFISTLEAKGSLELIEIPTAYTLPRGNFLLNFRMYKEGGIMTKLRLGFTDYIMLGVPIDVRRAVGDKKAQCDFPLFVSIRMRLIPSRGTIPNTTIGFDPYSFSQYGREWEELRYLLYATFSRKTLLFNLPLTWTLGISNDLKGFKWENAFLFGGVDIPLTPELEVLADAYDVRERRRVKFNAGIRYLIQPKLRLEILFKDLSVETPERVIVIGYRDRFF